MLHLSHFGAGSHGQAGPVTTGNGSAHGAGVAGCAHGQAAIAEFKEHVAIPTAIAAATVSFLIVIFTSFVFIGFCCEKPEKSLKTNLYLIMYFN